MELSRGLVGPRGSAVARLQGVTAQLQRPPGCFLGTVEKPPSQIAIGGVQASLEFDARSSRQASPAHRSVRVDVAHIDRIVVRLKDRPGHVVKREPDHAYDECRLTTTGRAGQKPLPLLGTAAVVNAWLERGYAVGGLVANPTGIYFVSIPVDGRAVQAR